MSNAREILAMRNQLHLALSPAELRTFAWGAVAKAAAEAIARGWTGEELAKWVIAELAGDPPNSAGAVALTALRQLAQEQPPRDMTPGPRHMSEIRAEQGRARAQATDVERMHEWAEYVRAQVREQRHRALPRAAGADRDASGG